MPDLKQFIIGDETHDPSVLNELGGGMPDASSLRYITLLAIYILEESYPEARDRWQLIVSKAKAYL